MAIPAYSGILDGKTFVGKNGGIGKSDSEDDEIKFENGKFLSVGCAKYGFGDADYTTKVDVGRRQEYFEQQGENLGGQGIHMLAAKSS